MQRSLWSATLPSSVEELARTFLRDPIRITVGHRYLYFVNTLLHHLIAHPLHLRDAATTTIKQRLVFVGREEGKLLMLRQIIAEVWALVSTRPSFKN